MSIRSFGCFRAPGVASGMFYWLILSYAIVPSTACTIPMPTALATTG